MLPSVPEAIESEPSASNSSSAINMNVDSTSEVKSGNGDAIMGEMIEVQIDKVAISENSSVISENEREDDKSMEITGETLSKSGQHLSSSKVGSTPNIHVDKCTDVKRSKYKRRMSKSCDELDVKIKPNTTSNWKSWSNFLSTISNSMTRIMNGLSNSTSHVDQIVDNQNEKPPEENQD